MVVCSLELVVFLKMKLSKQILSLHHHHVQIAHILKELPFLAVFIYLSNGNKNCITSFI